MNILFKISATALILFGICYLIYDDKEHSKFNSGVAILGVASLTTLISCALIAIWQS